MQNSRRTPYRSVVLTMLECTIDDMNPEFYPAILRELRHAGAKDCWLTPVVAKEGRPATVLSVLTTEAEELTALDILFATTTTLGIRSYPVTRYELERAIRRVQTPYGEISVKVGLSPSGTVLNAAPEYRECEAAAAKLQLPVKQVYAGALSAAQELLGSR